MNCNDTRRFLDADVDGELDLVPHLELDAHLRTCPECARLAENSRARRAALRESLPRFTAPAALADKIRIAIGSRDGWPVGRQLATADEAPASTQRTAASPRAKIIFPLWQIAGLAASVAFALLAGFAWGNARARTNLLIDDAVSDHVRSLQANHLTDVASTDQHTVKPWFAGKLDFAPPVVDLAEVGFPLVGGRLEHIDGRAAAALVFRRRQHAVNLIIWPSIISAVSARQAERNGYNVVAWSQVGLNFLVVSEIPSTELLEFAEQYRHRQR